MNGQCFLPFMPGIEVCFPNNVSSPFTNYLVDDYPNSNLSDVRGVPIPSSLDQTPSRLRVPHLRTTSDLPVMVSTQYVPSPSFPSRGSRRLASARSLPSYPEHAQSAHSQHRHTVSDDYGRTSVRHYRSASSSPYRSTAQLPYLDQAYLRHWDPSSDGPKVSPGVPPPPSPQAPHTPSPQLDRSVQAPARYECTYCGKAFNRPSSLKTHINTHTGEKRMFCRRNWKFVGL